MDNEFYMAPPPGYIDLRVQLQAMGYMEEVKPGVYRFSLGYFRYAGEERTGTVSMSGDEGEITGGAVYFLHTCAKALTFNISDSAEKAGIGDAEDLTFEVGASILQMESMVDATKQVEPWEDTLDFLGLVKQKDSLRPGPVRVVFEEHEHDLLLSSLELALRAIDKLGYDSELYDSAEEQKKALFELSDNMLKLRTRGRI
jgi:SpoU rRNA methylase family enzyme